MEGREGGGDNERKRGGEGGKIRRTEGEERGEKGKQRNGQAVTEIDTDTWVGR